MIAENSAYAALGLRPGAGRAEVDEAYRRLIKRYHPDRMGGDCSRAAEINRAYSEIRRQAAGRVAPPRSVPVPARPRRPSRRSRRRAGWLMASLVLGAGAVALANGVPRSSSDFPADAVAFELAPAAGPAGSTAVSPLTAFDEPLETKVIDRAIADAVSFHSAGDPAATVEYSRACHDSFRREPSLAWFDACIAFDETTLILQGADLFQSGPFDSSSVMARHMGAAKLLSHDVLAADSRLHRIRSRVELAVVPRLDEAAAQQL